MNGRLARPLLVLAASLMIHGALLADESFTQVTLGSRPAYIVPAKYATDHQADLLLSIPGAPKVEGYWTPLEQDVAVAERVLRELRHDAVRDPKLIFPNLTPKAEASSPESAAYEANELALAVKNEESYIRQYVGLIIDGRKVVLCNYSDVPNVDPAKEFLYLHKYFDPKGTVHFLQSRVDPNWKICSNVAMIGSWAPKEK